MVLNKLFRKKNSYNEITNDKYQCKKYEDYIEYYGLQDFWEGLSIKERESIKIILFSTSNGRKNYNFSERLLIKSLKYNPNPINLHFIYNDYIIKEEMKEKSG